MVSVIAAAVAATALLIACAAFGYVVWAVREMKRLAEQADADAARAGVAFDRSVNVVGPLKLADITRWSEQQSKALGL